MKLKIKSKIFSLYLERKKKNKKKRRKKNKKRNKKKKKRLFPQKKRIHQKYKKKKRRSGVERRSYESCECELRVVGRIFFLLLLFIFVLSKKGAYYLKNEIYWYFKEDFIFS